jgi:hypothetical protein
MSIGEVLFVAFVEERRSDCAACYRVGDAVIGGTVTLVLVIGVTFSCFGALKTSARVKKGKQLTVTLHRVV